LEKGVDAEVAEGYSVLDLISQVINRSGFGPRLPGQPERGADSKRLQNGGERAMFDENSAPIFVQIRERLKDDILSGVYGPGELMMSTTQIAKLYSVNPATAVKSVGMLAEEGIVYKKRGIGMCVTERAQEQILKERTAQFYDRVIAGVIREAKKLNIRKDALIRVIREEKDYD
jgi:DNA-binding transcriptional regulator YhcF (GntR family)